MIICSFCKSSKRIVKSGFRNNKCGKKQRYVCNLCNHLFVPNDGFWKMAHEARTDWSMLLGSIFLLIVAAGKFFSRYYFIKE